MSEKSGWENLGLGVSSDEQVSIAAVPSCNIENQETTGEDHTELMGHGGKWRFGVTSAGG